MTSRDHLRDEGAGSGGAMRRQGSVRRVVHDGPPVGALPARALVPPTPPPPYPVFTTFMQEYAIIYEFNVVCDQCIPGVYVIPSAKSPLVWFGVIFVKDGPYKGAALRFTLFLPEEFPSTSSPPKVLLEGERLWHPNVDLETGEVGLSLPWWRGRRVKEALDRLAALLASPDPSLTPLPNPHARNRYENDRAGFESLAKGMSERSWTELLRGGSGPWSSDPHYPVFEEFEPITHQPALSRLKKESKPDMEDPDWLSSMGAKRGLSWVRQGSLLPFSKLVT